MWQVGVVTQDEKRRGMVAPRLIVIGGVPGAGKSVLAARLARELSLPLLGSDTIGGAIREKLRGTVESSEAFGAGYEVLFTLAETFVRSRCSVVVDTNLGWEFQWQRLDSIANANPGVSLCPIILRCPRDLAVERISRRSGESGGAAAAAKMIKRHPNVWDYLDHLDRHDAYILDATQEAERVYAEALRYLRSQRRAIDSAR